MSDYIKREDAVRRIAVLMAAEAESDGCEDQPMDNYIEYASEDLADIPPADVVPVRHGHWEVIDAEEPRRYGCSECKRLSWHMENYCPNCGAIMDGEDNEII